MTIALYRKYRPKLFDDLLGQEHIVEILTNAAKKNRLSHGYLLYGPRGSGKTTVARLIAKIANCETRANDDTFRKTGEPCNRCPRCIEIDSGRALDIIEIDAASNRGIDEIRNLRESARLSPTIASNKVFIIDESHQLTRDAWNALLKTLEEPPLHTIFILATTEFEKVPATIASRTQRFHFRKLPVDVIVTKLAQIAGTEGLTITDDAIELIAAAADGSLRDAEALIDQLTALEKNVTAERVEKIIGRVGYTRTAALADLIIAGKLDESLEYVAQFENDGYNVTDLAKELIHYFRRTLSLQFDPKLEQLFRNDLTANELTKLKSHSKLVSAKRYIPFIRSLIRAWSDMRYSPFTSIPLEIALIEHLSDNAKQ